MLTHPTLNQMNALGLAGWRPPIASLSSRLMETTLASTNGWG